MMINNPQKLSIDEEDAFNFIVHCLASKKSHFDSYGYEVYLPKIIQHYLHSQVKGFDLRYEQTYIGQLSAEFMSAAWELCRRGVLRPGVRAYQQQVTDDGSGGNGYCITSLGRDWLSRAQDFDYVFVEPGRFASLFSQMNSRFGVAYAARSQEAIRCYRALAYLACCAMCGAAAESVLLALAIAKNGDEQAVEKMYSSSGGRGRVESLVIGQQTDQVKAEMRGYLTLLKYWRDSAAHGSVEGLAETEAYTSLTTLLRFALYADERWETLIA
ncbi:MAG: hypothetical protein KGJ62_01615 [Armatimonadetes bacterium]|nr:hypothetical protein [Armatimonadota bacterium]MDE2205478.1 hypothetical protein [Armatimonadota bacterium]